MKKNFSLPVLCLVFLLAISAAIAQGPTLNIVPKPASVKFLDGKFELDSHTRIIASDEAGRRLAVLLNDYLQKNYGFALKYKETAKAGKNTIIFSPQTSDGENAAAEAYTINVTKDGVRIGGRDAGQFYALQSFLQMLPAKLDAGKAALPAVDIADGPRFRYRGMHLDVGRHFMPVAFLKTYLDLMAQYKFNYFHWHLTEDQGWRIEIKKYPKLTEIGGYRKESVKDRQLNPYVGDNFPHGGFYTQEQVKEIVAYAKVLHITVIPEIEMPGHSAAAIAAYPELACKEEVNKYEVMTTWGIFKQTYCPKEETFKFLEDVLTEVIALFPDSPYIHVGGDEVLKDQWKESSLVQELKQNEKLKDENEVQSYFIRRMEKFINSKGKRIIGWDEILEGGIAPDATIMSWRGTKGGVEAAKAHHDVIMTPTDYCYFDFYQGDPRTEPLAAGYLPLEKVYSFDPVPAALSADEAKYIIGGQANVWTEYMPGPDKVEYMVFPRLLALSEKLWSPAATSDYKDFTARLPYQLTRLDKQNIGYRIPEPAGLKNIILAEGQTSTEVTLHSLPNSRLYYTLDGGEPSEFSTIYNAPVKISLGSNSSVVLKTIVVTENGRKSSTYSAVVTNRKMLPASPVDPKIEGMTYALYKGTFNSVQIMDGIEPVAKGETKTFALKPLNEKENFGVTWDAYIKVPEDGLYDFTIDSDDGATLLIDDQTVVDNDGIHTRKTASSDVPLAKGFHKIRVKYFQKDGEMLLNLRWCVKGRNWLGLSGLYH